MEELQVIGLKTCQKSLLKTVLYPFQEGQGYPNAPSRQTYIPINETDVQDAADDESYPH